MLSAVLVQARTVVLCWFNSVMKIGEKSLKKPRTLLLFCFCVKFGDVIVWQCGCMFMS